jgi:hypothetical protein
MLLFLAAFFLERGAGSADVDGARGHTARGRQMAGTGEPGLGSWKVGPLPFGTIQSLLPGADKGRASSTRTRSAYALRLQLGVGVAATVALALGVFEWAVCVCAAHGEGEVAVGGRSNPAANEPRRAWCTAV